MRVTRSFDASNRRAPRDRQAPSRTRQRRIPVEVLIGISFLACPVAAALGQGQSVVDTKHNLSASGTGAIRATTERQVCIFCHTAHNASPVQPLWNRRASVAPYTIYTSSSLDAEPGQPTGASKMCLSCHDGSIALGSVVSRDQTIRMAGGITTIPPGAANLGTDLSDDHPVSFRYDSLLAATDTRLRDPAGLPAELRLDANRELQCTTCHDAHDDSFGHFLVDDNTDSALCRACHQISDTAVVAHEDCRACHQSHTAPSGPFLLVEDRPTNACLSCHDGSQLRAADIESDLSKISRHDTDSPADPPEPVEGHATCADCHEPHTMFVGSATAPALHPNFGRAPGVGQTGGPVAVSSYEYEVCFRCHGDTNVSTSSWISRQITQTNTRLEFDLAAISYHPVEGPGRNPDVPSLKPGWNEASVMYCSDCHGSDTSRKAGGSGPDGVHGSNIEPLLLARYSTIDFTPESASAYALCYRCHNREGMSGILRDRSFPHRKHVVEARAPCSICHDAHGISSAQGNRTGNSHLINFDTTIVFQLSGRLEYLDTGTFSGQCTLVCHGEPHSSTAYAN
ncbi:MAG: cytochrome c3 family protein [Planctomycetota bacterium]|jgi:predicted CXXCH cytochrome family protein